MTALRVKANSFKFLKDRSITSTLYLFLIRAWFLKNKYYENFFPYYFCENDYFLNNFFLKYDNKVVLKLIFPKLFNIENTLKIKNKVIIRISMFFF